MSTYCQELNGDIKFCVILDREVFKFYNYLIQNNPIIFFNFDNPEKEIEHQYQIFACLEIINYKAKEKKDSNGYYTGLLMPLFDMEKDLGVYGYIGNNEIKVLLIKNLETNDDSKKEIQKIMTNIHNNYSNMIMNPFFNKKLLQEDIKNSLKDKFINDVINNIKSLKVKK